ncbi:MAG TPA: ASPIC/UnbV domain-containing protein, partial [Thermoanaerobaculia bacterium]|nr:ASPIC/UnbV domain-containing protein [Thermoanaerobaculia bacterium]
TFGVFFFDADLDGRTDLLLANGHVEPTVQAVQKNVTYRQSPILYWNRGGGRFTPLGNRSGDLERPLVGRGAAYADLDGDGDLDVVIVENGGPARVFLNHLDRASQSVRVKLAGSGRSNRDAVGARVTARIGRQSLTQEVSGGQSYLSAPEKTLTFGLGRASKIDSLEIRWPDGTLETRRDVPGGSALFLEEGKRPATTR